MQQFILEHLHFTR